MSLLLQELRSTYREALDQQEKAWNRHKEYLSRGDTAGAQRAYDDAQSWHRRAANAFADWARQIVVEELDNPRE